MLIRVFVEKLDARTKEEWEKRVSELGRRKTLSDLQAFVEQRYKFLAKTVRPSQATQSTSNEFTTPRPHRPSVALHTNEGRCLFCFSNHLLSQCKGFKRLETDRRIKTVKEVRVCLIVFSRHTPLRPAHAARAASAA